MHDPRQLIPLLLVALLAAAPAAAENAWLASTSIRVIDLDSGRLVGQLDVAADQVVREIVFDAEGRRAWVASMGGLFEVDPSTLEITRQLSSRPTAAVAWAALADRLVAIHLKPAGEGLADRERNIPSTVTLQLYDANRAAPLAAAEVHGTPVRVRLSPAADRAYVLDAKDAVLSVFDGDVSRLGEIDLAPDVSDGRPLMCSDLGQAADGRLAVVRNSGDDTALVFVTPGAAPEQAGVSVESMGFEHRARGAAWLPDGSGVWVSALGHVARYTPDRPDVRWQHVGHSFASVAAAPSGRYLVMATPIFDEARGSGALLVADPEGHPLRVVELTDISPYTLAIQP